MQHAQRRRDPCAQYVAISAGVSSAFVRDAASARSASAWRARAATTRARTSADDSPRGVGAQRVERQRRDLDGQIQPIAQRARQPIAVARHLRRRAAALARRIAGEPARARVHRADEHEAGGEDRRARRAGDRHAPFLERLTQHLQDVAAELEHLVEEQHAVMREADLAGTRLRSAADQRGVRDRVMRRAKRALGDQPRARRQQADDRVDRRDVERLVERQRRQDARHASRHHRLAGARRSDEQQVVTAGRGDLERAPREQLAADVGEIRAERGGAGRQGGTGRRRGEPRRPKPPDRSARGPHRPATRPATISRPETIAASLAFAAGSRMPCRPSRRAAAAIGSTPRVA